jgi:hypothetical protein
MKDIVLINGSLRGGKASSLAFLHALRRKLESKGRMTRLLTIGAKSGGGLSTPDYEALSRADAIVLAFPLFSYCVPGALMRFLEQWYRFARSDGKNRAGIKVYAIVNSGCPKPEINAEAIRVVANFSRRMGLRWGFAVAIGGGMLVRIIMAWPLAGRAARRALAAVAQDIAGGESGASRTINVRPPLPQALMDRARDIAIGQGTRGKGATAPAR